MSAHYPLFNFVSPEVVGYLLHENDYQSLPKQATRHSYAEAIIEVGAMEPDVVVLDADVSTSIKTPNSVHVSRSVISILVSPNRI